MANATYEVKRIVFSFNEHFTEVEVICGPASDGTLGIQGSHKKTFPPNRSAHEILMMEIGPGEYLLW